MSTFNLKPEEARQNWVEALRSGKYKQCGDHLSRDGSYCCLGVACDLFMKYEPGLLVENDNDGPLAAIGYAEPSTPNSAEYYKLPPTVQDWLQLKGSLGEWSKYDEDDDTTYSDSLAETNDSGATFEEIANIIESDAFTETGVGAWEENQNTSSE